MSDKIQQLQTLVRNFDQRPELSAEEQELVNAVWQKAQAAHAGNADAAYEHAVSVLQAKYAEWSEGGSAPVNNRIMVDFARGLSTGSIPFDAVSTEAGAASLAQLQQIIAGVASDDSALQSLRTTVDFGMDPGSWHGVGIPEGTRLRINFALERRDGKLYIDPENTELDFIDGSGRARSVKTALSFAGLSGLDLKVDAGGETADLRLDAWALWILPADITVQEDIPLEFTKFLEAMQRAQSAPKPVGVDGEPNDPPPVRTHDVRFDVTGEFASGDLSLPGDPPTRFSFTSPTTVHVTGSPTLVQATINGDGVSVQSPMLQTGPSDIHGRFTLDRRPGGKHKLEFDDTTLRNVAFNQGGQFVPAGGIEALKLNANEPAFGTNDARFEALVRLSRERDVPVPQGVVPFSGALYGRVLNPEMTASLTARHKPEVLPQIHDGALDDCGREDTLRLLRPWAALVTQDLEAAFISEHGGPRRFDPSQSSIFQSYLQMGGGYGDLPYEVRATLQTLRNPDTGVFEEQRVLQFMMTARARELLLGENTSDTRDAYSRLTGFSLNRAQEMLADVQAHPNHVPRTYDFRFTIDPHNDATIQTVIAKVKAKIAERFGDGALENLDLSTLMAQVGSRLGAGGDSSGPITIEADQVNLLDLITHFEPSAIWSNPEIQARLIAARGDAGMQELVGQARARITDLMAASQLRSATALAPEQMATLLVAVGKTGDPRFFAALDHVSPALKADILAEVNGTATGTPVLDTLRGFASGPVGAPTLLATQNLLRGMGNQLFADTKLWFRQAWLTQFGGVQPRPEALAFLESVFEATVEELRRNPNAATTLPEGMLDQLSDPQNRREMITMALYNASSAVAVGTGPLLNGWGAVRQTIEDDMLTLYGGVGSGGTAQNQGAAGIGSIQGIGTEHLFSRDNQRVFLSDVHHIGDGHDFFENVEDLLRATRDAYTHGDARNDPKPPILLNYWALQADEEGVAQDVVKELRKLADAGFPVSIIVDGKNGPARRGMAVLQREFPQDPSARGYHPNVQLHAWMPPNPEDFAQGTHVKYLATPLGVITGGSNIGQHYEHWSDTNVAMTDEAMVRETVNIHTSIMREQGLDPTAIAGYYDGNIRGNVDQNRLWNPDPDTMTGSQRVRVRTIVDQGGDAHDRILLETIAALEMTPPGETVYIPNAYFVVDQPLADHPLAAAINRALRRDVNIEILTNSETSIDEPAVAAPIMKSVFLIAEMADHIAAEIGEQNTGRLIVHLPKHTETIHDKGLFTGSLAMVGTYNLHPRSFTLEKEMLVELLGQPVSELTDAADIQAYLSSPAIRDYLKNEQDWRDRDFAARAAEIAASPNRAEQLEALRAGWLSHHLNENVVEHFESQLKNLTKQPERRAYALATLEYLGYEVAEREDLANQILAGSSTFSDVAGPWLQRVGAAASELHGPALSQYLRWLEKTQECTVVTAGGHGATGSDADLAMVAQRLAALGYRGAMTDLFMGIF